MTRIVEPARRSLLSLAQHGFHRVAYREWGDAAAPDAVVCVHGLTRNGRDFDDLARVLAPTFRVLCVDLPGRGDSEWLAERRDYAVPTYLAALAALIARSGAERVLWVGTSLGGVLGMLMAAQRASPVAALVLNDIGPEIGPEALARIGSYVGLDPRFDSFAELEQHVRTVAAPFGPLTDAQWRRVAENGARLLADGRYALGYDPAIGGAFRDKAAQPGDLWPLWDLITCPTLVVRGGRSDVLSAETALQMTRRGPRARLVEFAEVGHAPMLMDAAQIDVVASFLAEHRTGGAAGGGRAQ